MGNPVEGERSLGPRRWGAAVLLGAAGYLLNLQPVPLSPGTDLVFGGVAYLLAAVALGPVPGLLAAAIASARTLWLWDHPYAWLIFSLEGAVVGYASHMRGRRPLVADLMYWTLAGLPLLYLTYCVVLGVSGTTALVLFLQQPFNGLINALGAEALFLLPPVRRALRAPGAPRLRSALAVVVTLAAVTPALGFGIWTGRQEWEQSVSRARERVALFARSYGATLQQYVELHEGAVRSVAEAAQLRGDLDPEHLQRLVAAEHAQFPGFLDMYAADARGGAVAYDPPPGARGDTLAGLEFGRRDLLRRLREGRGTVVSGVLEGRGEGEEPLVLIAHPIVLADTLAGYVVGALDLRALPLPVVPADSAEGVRVADAAGTLVYDSRARHRAGELPRTLQEVRSFEAIRAVGENGTTTYRGPGAAAPTSATAAQVLAGVARVRGPDWWVWAEQPFSGIQAFAADAYVRLLALLILVTLLALGISDVLAAYLAGPLLRMREAAAALAAGGLDARVGSLPEAVPGEIRELGQAFDEMAASLSGRSQELEELGEIARSLASTLDADELLRRITDAADRLVEADGCGIALLRPGGALLAADYALGLLAPTAGREIPLEDSVIGWVLRQGSPVLLPDAASDPRIRRAYIDPGAVGSVMCSPLLGRSGPLGTLTAVRARAGGRPFAAADLRLLERLARHAAVAVENANLVAAERRRARESEAIQRVARTVSAAQGLGETLAVVAREAGRIVRSGACTVALLRGGGEDEEQLEVVAVSGEAESPVGALLPVESRLLQGPVSGGGRTPGGEERYEASVPLRVGEETLGLLTASRRSEPFGPPDAALLAAFADHAAVALRNAALLEAAQEASRAKSDFIATMSHELRTPLNAVLGHLQLLEMELHGPVTEAQRAALGRIGAASRHLRGLIEEVLSFARLEAGRTEVRIAEADLGALAEEVAAVIEPLARDKELGFHIHRHEGAAVVPTDADKVRQILINLAGNAVKFTERGEVRIRVEPRDGEVVLAVEDTGPGIAPRDRARLFRPFEQLQSGFSRSHEGTGLGLYLSGRYAALIGGRIEVESEPGRGSVFSLVLPRTGPPVSDGGDSEERRTAA